MKRLLLEITISATITLALYYPLLFVTASPNYAAGIAAFVGIMCAAIARRTVLRRM